MKSIRFSPLFLCLALCATAASQAIPNVPYLSLRQQSAWLLTDGSIQREIKLTPVELVRVRAAFDHLGAGQRAIYSRGRADRAALQKLDVTTSESALGALSLTERHRLFQLAIQTRGVSAMLDREVATSLSLSSEQQKQISELVAKYEDEKAELNSQVAHKIMEAGQAGNGKSRLAIMQSFEPQRKALEEKHASDDATALAILTPAQRAKFLQMEGPTRKRA